MSFQAIAYFIALGVSTLAVGVSYLGLFQTAWVNILGIEPLAADILGKHIKDFYTLNLIWLALLPFLSPSIPSFFTHSLPPLPPSSLTLSLCYSLTSSLPPSLHTTLHFSYPTSLSLPPLRSLSLPLPPSLTPSPSLPLYLFLPYTLSLLPLRSLSLPR